jgi:hypothetical protein
MVQTKTRVKGLLLPSLNQLPKNGTRNKRCQAILISEYFNTLKKNVRSDFVSESRKLAHDSLKVRTRKSTQMDEPGKEPKCTYCKVIKKQDGKHCICFSAVRTVTGREYNTLTDMVGAVLAQPL